MDNELPFTPWRYKMSTVCCSDCFTKLWGKIYQRIVKPCFFSGPIEFCSNNARSLIVTSICPCNIDSIGTYREAIEYKKSPINIKHLYFLQRISLIIIWPLWLSVFYLKILTVFGMLYIIYSVLLQILHFIQILFLFPSFCE